MAYIDAPRLDEDYETKDCEVFYFIGKYILCSVPIEKAHPKLNSLEKVVQTHHITSYIKKDL